MRTETSSTKQSVRNEAVSQASPQGEPAELQRGHLLLSAGAIAAALLLHTLALAELIDRQLTVLPLLLLFIAGVRYNRAVDFRGPPLRFATFFIVSLLIAVAPQLLEAGGVPVGLGLRRLGMVLLGWTLVVWLPRGSSRSTHEWATPTRFIVAVIVATLVLAALRHRMIVGQYAVLQDEVLYLLQSAWLANPGFGWQLDPAMLPFVRPEYTFFHNNVLTTQYPPGWPALLAAFSTIGLRWWSTPLLVAVAVLFTFFIGRELQSPRVGIVAAIIVAIQPWILESADGYMAHAASTAFVTAAAYCLLRGDRAAPPWRFLVWALAGLLLGATIATRPLTGLAIGTSLVLWIIIRNTMSLSRAAVFAVCVGIGALPAVLALLYYNQVTNGNPLTLGYAAVHGQYHSLGFGRRGALLYAGQLQPTYSNIDPFTPHVALLNFARRGYEFAARVLPCFLLVPLLWLGGTYRFPFRLRAIVPFLLLPLAYFFYFFTNIRFYTELIPFIAIGAALLLAHVAREGRPLILSWVLAIVVLGNLADAVATTTSALPRARDVTRNAQVLKNLSDDVGNIVVFIQEPMPESYLFRRLSFFNEDGFASRIVVARDRGPENTVLMERLPGHAPYLAIKSRGAALLALRPVERP